MRHTIEQIARANTANMEATFSLMRDDSLGEYERGELFGRYEQLLIMSIRLQEALDTPKSTSITRGWPGY